MRALPLIALALGALGCPGTTDTPPDTDRGAVPVPDFGPIVDGGGQNELSVAGDLGDGPTAAPDQGTTCSSQGISFKLNSALVTCQTTSVTVTGPTSYNWVMVGITSIPKGSTKWSGGATNVSCNPSCSWTFKTAAVPCDPGPYSLSLTKDATNDDPSKGVIVATCTP